MNSNRSSTPINNLVVHGISDSIPESKAAVCRSRLINSVGKLMSDTGLREVNIAVSTNHCPQSNNSIGQHKTDSLGKNHNDEPTVEERAKQYKSQGPLYNFDFLVVSDIVMQDLQLAISLIELESKVFDEWGLRRIEPFPRTALNFYGPPGTGKTLAAHAIANHIGSPIMIASYAQIESKFHGDGPKNVEALFYAAERDKSILFIDEADSLLSKRLTNVTQGSEQAINSMRSQLLISLEKFKGVIIFATNLVENYDKAFETRVRNIHFPLPDEEGRLKIWKQHLGNGAKPPLANDVNPHGLTKIDEICGRDIKNAVIDAALRAAKEKDEISQTDLIAAIERVKAAKIKTEEKLPKNARHADEKTSEHILQALEEHRK